MYKDEYFESRDSYQVRNLNDVSIADRSGLNYDIVFQVGTILDGRTKQW
ncbi:hypothetical protein SAMN04488130_10175 [Flavobacterium urumqiense]|uniref:Uncharacterized protein n=1 Tax=Flavobacterium urumqiense TaxID=935224 RepID=A0A1H5RYB7_9FLAO|nr:hypothetical protein SAMN04488130_10175 [Flavobacterium urumqiense]